jgi:hypothetical protein
VPGRFPLITDENITGPLVQGLRERGWDIVRTIDVFGEHSADEPLLIWAVEHGRALVTTDADCLAIAHRWLREMRSFQMIFWPQQAYQHVRVGSFLKAFEDLALKDDFFAACVVHLHIDALS